MRIAILCLGSQGDVRPFVALGAALKAEGHEVVVLANSPHEKLFSENGLTFFPLPGDLASLVSPKQSEMGLGKIQAVRQLIEIIKDALHEQFEILHAHLQNVDGVFCHPAVFAAEHVIEAFQLPSVRIHFHPDIRSKHYACCIFPPKMPFQQWANLASHFIAAQLFWLPWRGIINRWRTRRLGLKKLGLLSPRSHQPFQKVPKLLAVSQALIPPASDWPENIHVTGYLQLAKAEAWTPPESLKRFLQAGAPPVYIGFGSLTERCDAAMSQAIVDILKQLPHRVILCGAFTYIKKE